MEDLGGTPERLDITDQAAAFLDGLGEHRKALLVERTLRALGVEDVDQVDEEAFLGAFVEQLKRMMATDVLERLEQQGLVEVVGLRNGEKQYQATEAGRQLAAQGEEE